MLEIAYVVILRTDVITITIATRSKWFVVQLHNLVDLRGCRQWSNYITELVIHIMLKSYNMAEYLEV